ncbi:MAG: protease IV [Syntrophaceae bacterium]|nr:MAG: protease IV [Syntrophaceae bacterium]
MADSRFEVLSEQILPPDRIFSPFLPKVLNLTQRVIALIVIPTDLKKGYLFMKKIIFITALCSLFLLSACSAPRLNIFDTTPNPLREFTLEGKGQNKILIIPINGMISDSPKQGLFDTSPSVVEQVVVQLNKAQNDSSIKAVLLKVNSSGGTITASDLLYHEILSYKVKTGNKISVVMMDLAASGAYYLSLPADMIIAHPTTITGSVGVIFMRPKTVGLMSKIGLGVEINKFGQNKDMGSPFRESNEEEKILMQKTVDTFGNRFINLVQKHRNLDEQALKEVSTARVFVADDALRLKLIDKIGYISDAVKETKTIAGLPDDARVVIYRRKDVPEDNYYRAAASGTANFSLINVAVPEIFNIKAGFYYLWPGAIIND